MINQNLIVQFESLRDEIIEGRPENAVEWLEIAIRNLKQQMPVDGPEDDGIYVTNKNRMDRENVESDRRMFGSVAGMAKPYSPRRTFASHTKPSDD